jgi:hypothetical protein
MTNEQKITMLRAMLDGDTTTSDEILSVYLELAAYKILNRMYPYKEDYTGLDVPDRYVAVQLKCACYAINKIGAEGEIQHIENGIHRNYGDADIPEQMLKDIVPFCQAIR